MLPGDGITLSCEAMNIFISSKRIIINRFSTRTIKRRRKFPDISENTLKSFFQNPTKPQNVSPVFPNGKTFFIETLGCQMNFADSEIVSSILHKSNYTQSLSLLSADVVLINTCAIRDHAEEKALQRLRTLKTQSNAIVGVLGCMAERMKEKLLNEHKLADLVVGPDEYREIPRLLSLQNVSNEDLIRVKLSLTETYEDIIPLRSDKNGVKGFVSIMRGCNNMCSYCVVPFTRGRERSRHPESILEEVRDLSEKGFKEVTLLGQNVNSYFYKNGKQTGEDSYEIAEGFQDMFNSKQRRGEGFRFSDLLESVARVDPEMRVRFTSPHPKDFNLDVLDVIQRNHNICNAIHIPVQTGSNEILNKMRRNYTKESYLNLIAKMIEKIENVEFSSDFISGFCGETEKDHHETLDILNQVDYAQAFLFAYSEREKTHAARKFKDDVKEDIKKRRLGELISAYRKNAEEKSKSLIGSEQVVLIEGFSKRSKNEFVGKTNGLRFCIVPKQKVLDKHLNKKRDIQIGDYVVVQVSEASASTLKCDPQEITRIANYYRVN
eukprot:snap_masked-scaffold_16-processed-gene-3.38-mRNA-1 protein AED:0.30 eAED:0.30 QI:0/-1/0/1/-1/1/1/0/549